MVRRWPSSPQALPRETETRTRPAAQTAATGRRDLRAFVHRIGSGLGREKARKIEREHTWTKSQTKKGR